MPNAVLICHTSCTWITSMSKLSPWPIQSVYPLHFFYILNILYIHWCKYLFDFGRKLCFLFWHNFSITTFIPLFENLEEVDRRVDRDSFLKIEQVITESWLTFPSLWAVFLVYGGLVKILPLKEYFFFLKIPNYHYCRIWTIKSE